MTLSIYLFFLSYPSLSLSPSFYISLFASAPSLFLLLPLSTLHSLFFSAIKSCTSYSRFLHIPYAYTDLVIFCFDEFVFFAISTWNLKPLQVSEFCLFFFFFTFIGKCVFAAVSANLKIHTAFFLFFSSNYTHSSFFYSKHLTKLAIGRNFCTKTDENLKPKEKSLHALHAFPYWQQMVLFSL